MRRLIVGFVVLFVVLTLEAQANVFLWNDEQITIDSSYQDVYLYDVSRAFIVPGGQVDELYAYDFSTVDMSGGSVDLALWAGESSTVNMSGGTIGGDLHALDSSTVNISGGVVNHLYARFGSTVNISGGTIGDFLRAHGVSTVNISGGTVSGGIDARFGSTVNMSGGTIGGDLWAYESSTVTFNVRDFWLSGSLTLDGERLFGTGILSGEWMDDTPRWEINIATNSGTGIFIVPEPVATLATVPADGNTVDFGHVRIGTVDSRNVVASNSGDPSSFLSGEFPEASDEFSPGTPEAFGPLGQGESAERTYRYSPTDHDLDLRSLTIASDAGNSEINLSGTGVGPKFDSSTLPGGVIDFGEVMIGLSQDAFLNIMNVTSDEDLGDLTGLTLLSATITGEDPLHFSVVGFSPGVVLSKSDGEVIQILFDTSGADLGSTVHAKLRILTDQNVPFGGSGDAFTFDLVATVVLPEPSSLALCSVLAGFGIAMGLRRRYFC